MCCKGNVSTSSTVIVKLDHIKSMLICLVYIIVSFTVLLAPVHTVLESNCKLLSANKITNEKYYSASGLNSIYSAVATMQSPLETFVRGENATSLRATLSVLQNNTNKFTVAGGQT